MADLNDKNVLHHDDNPSHVDEAAEAAGGISGTLAGAAIGSAGGPIGTIIGGIAGAVGGWWAGRTVSEAATKFTSDDDDYYRRHYEGSPNQLADRKYDEVRPAYQLGHIAAANPDYRNKDFDTIEGDLQRGWNNDLRRQYGDWNNVRGYAREGYSRAGERMRAGANKVIDAVDNVKDRVDGNPASVPGPDATDRRL